MRSRLHIALEQRLRLHGIARPLVFIHARTEFSCRIPSIRRRIIFVKVGILPALKRVRVKSWLRTETLTAHTTVIRGHIKERRSFIEIGSIHDTIGPTCLPVFKVSCIDRIFRIYFTAGAGHKLRKGKGLHGRSRMRIMIDWLRHLK